jgi:hypothetical protein
MSTDSVIASLGCNSPKAETMLTRACMFVRQKHRSSGIGRLAGGSPSAASQRPRPGKSPLLFNEYRRGDHARFRLFGLCGTATLASASGQGLRLGCRDNGPPATLRAEESRVMGHHYLGPAHVAASGVSTSLMRRSLPLIRCPKASIRSVICASTRLRLNRRLRHRTGNHERTGIIRR